MLEKRLSSLRKENNLTQEDLAEKIGVARTTYAMYEQGKRRPDYDTLQKIAYFFGVNRAYLLGDSDDPKEKDDEIRPLTSEEEVFFKDWDKLNKEQQEKVMDYVRLLRLEAKQYNKQFDDEDSNEGSSKKRY